MTSAVAGGQPEAPTKDSWLLVGSPRLKPKRARLLVGNLKRK